MANNIREIITQAVIAKGKKRTLNKYPFVIENYDKILGCWSIYGIVIMMTATF